MKNLARSIAAFSLTLALSASSGCGESKGAPDLTPFLGTWSVSAAAITVLCDDNSVKAISVTDPTVMVMGTDSDLVDDNPTCPVRYDVSDGVAHAQPGQSCNHPDVVTPMHLLDGTFTLEGAAMAKHNASGKLDGYINISLGQTVLCTFNEMGVYRRGGN